MTPHDHQVAGVLAEFADPEALKRAAAGVRDRGFKCFDCYTPYAVHGLDRAMGLRPSILGWLVTGAGACGLVTALTMQWWMNAVDYPIVVSGKPLFSLPAFVPVMFELTVLFSAFMTFFGMLALNRLPRPHHPVFSSDRFARATDDGFFLSIEARDPKFDVQATRRLLESLGGTHVELLSDE